MSCVANATRFDVFLVFNQCVDAQILLDVDIVRLPRPPRLVKKTKFSLFVNIIDTYFIIYNSAYVAHAIESCRVSRI